MFCYLYFRRGSSSTQRIDIVSTPFQSNFIRLGLIWQKIQEEKPFLPWDILAVGDNQRPCGCFCHSGECEMAMMFKEFPYKPANKRIRVLKRKRCITKVKISSNMVQVFTDKMRQGKKISRNSSAILPPIVSPLCSKTSYKNPQHFLAKPTAFYIKPESVESKSNESTDSPL